MVDKKNVAGRLAKRIGKNIAVQRKRLQWTQSHLAERVGVDAETISRFERGVNLPSLPTLEGLASALAVDVSDLLSRASQTVPDDAAVLGAWLQGLTTKDRDFVMKIVLDCCEHLRHKSE